MLSLGAGTQSTDLLLRALRGEFDTRPDYAVFADLSNEPKGVYRYLDWFIPFVDKEYGFDIQVISFNIYQDCLDFLDGKTKRSDGIPLHLKLHNGKRGLLRRQCTGYYKIAPVRRFIKKNWQPGEKVELWLGISYDEMQRMKDSGRKWIYHRYPLVEKKIKRKDCITNFKKHGLPLPIRSSCTICPYHSNEYWYWLYVNEPESFETAVYLDERVRHYPGIDYGECYLHRSCKPLKEAIQDIINKKESLQDPLPELVDECDGVCST